MVKNILIVTIFSLGLFCSKSFPQNTDAVSEAKKEAVQIDSFGRINRGDFRGRLDAFLAALSYQYKGSRGLVVNYGSVREIAVRERVFSDHVDFRNFDKTLISYVRGGNVSEFRTDLWIIPNGAQGPSLPPEAFIADEFGRVTKAKFLAGMKRLDRSFTNYPNHSVYIINYGTNAEIATREKWIRDGITFRMSHDTRITLVRGGKINGPRTVIWLIPEWAANPVP